MQSPTSMAIRGLSILISILLLFSISLHAQNKVVIKERLEINPKSNHTLQADMSLSDLPYFVGSLNPGRGDVDPKDYSQSCSVLRPCIIICTGTFECAEAISVDIIVDGIGVGIRNRTDSLRMDCGTLFWRLMNLTYCGNFFNVEVSGNISDQLITCTMHGDWCCWVPHYVPFTATMTFQAIPITSREPSTIVMNAARTSFDARWDGIDNLWTSLFPTVCDRSGNQFSYCGPAPMLVTIENPINGTYFIDDPTNITNLGTSRTIENGGGVLFYWDGSDLPDGKDSLDISIKAECLGMVGTQKIQLKKYIYPCLVVKISKKEMSPGDTAAINLIALKNGIEQSYPADQDFTVSMNTDEKYGRLHCASPNNKGSYVYGQQPFEFIAATSIDVDSIVVEIGAREGGGGASSIGIVTKDTLRLTEPITVSKQGTAKNIGDVSNEMKRKNIELSMNTLQARLNKESEKKGNEKHKQKLAIGIEQLKARLAYETAKTPTEKQNALANLKQVAMFTAEAEECKSIDSVTIKKRTIEPFCQSDGRWARTKYDNYVMRDKDGNIIKDKDGNPVYYGVGDKGCALTCMAMIAHAGGADTDPGKLANRMNDPSHYGFSGTGVRWNAIDGLSDNSKYKYSDYGGDGLQYKSDKTVDLQNSTTISLTDMDAYLNEGALIIAQVYNPSTNGNHWVLVTSKDGNDYSIIDPGCYAGRTNLSGDYQNSVYRFIVYGKK